MSERVLNSDGAHVNLRTFCLIIVLLGLIVYSNSFFGEFLWDDYPLIINNYLIQSWRYLPTIFISDLYKVTGGKTNFYRPLVSISFMWDYFLWKDFSFGYHFTNVIFHLLNASLFFLILNIITDNKIISFWSSLLFLLHPFNSPVVAYISGRADSLAMLFILLSFLCFLQWDKKDRGNYYLFSVAGFIFALLSKEIAIIFPLLLLVYLIYFNRWVKIQLLGLLSFLFISLAYSILRCTILDFSYQPIFLSKCTFFERLITIPKTILSYLQVLVFPFNLHMEKTVSISRTLIDTTTLLPFFALILIFLLIVLLHRKNKIISYGFLWFIIALFPVLGFLPLNASMADHWLYLPSLGFFLSLTTSLNLIFKQKQNIILTIICLIFAIVTINRNTDWKDEFTFFKRTLAKAPHSARLHEALGTAYAFKGFYAQAMEAYKDAIRLKPDMFQAHFNLGTVYQKFSLFPQAEAEYKKTLELYPNLAEAHNNLGVIYFYQKNYQAALNEYNKTIELYPDYAQAYNNRGAVYASLGELNKAKQDWEKAICLKPDYQSPKLNLKAYSK